MLVKISQLRVTDARIELVRQLHLTNSSFALITFKLAVQKLKTHQVSFRKLRVEFLSAIDLLLRALYPRRLCWLLKHRHVWRSVRKSGVCQREVRVGLDRALVKS